MRKKLIWAAVIVLPLLVLGGLVHAHSSKAPVSSEQGSACNCTCPLQMLHNYLMSFFE